MAEIIRGRDHETRRHRPGGTSRRQFDAEPDAPGRENQSNNRRKQPTLSRSPLRLRYQRME
jgi:hypothetical protein